MCFGEPVDDEDDDEETSCGARRGESCSKGGGLESKSSSDEKSKGSIVDKYYRLRGPWIWTVNVVLYCGGCCLLVQQLFIVKLKLWTKLYYFFQQSWTGRGVRRRDVTVRVGSNIALCCSSRKDHEAKNNRLKEETYVMYQ